MYRLGNIFRGKYIAGGNGNNSLGEDYIPGLAARLDNDQIFIHAYDAPHIYGSAQAFMQGLYPPTSLTTNTTSTPLGGYQYPHIQTVGEYDPQSIYIGGDKYCPTSIQQSRMYEITTKYLETKKQAEPFYQGLPPSLLGNVMKKTNIDFAEGMNIYDYVQYQYNHDNSVRDLLSANDSKTLDQLRFYSDEKAWYYWGNTSESSTDTDYRAMAGKTLAARILGQFQRIVDNRGNATNGYSQPLSLLFGDHQPMISLFALTMLDQREKNFRSLPGFASAMVFELYSSAEESSFPTKKEDLRVRFRFQNSTDFSKNMSSFALFNNPRSQADMTWPTFENMFSRIMVNALADWCGECASGSLFCWGVDNSTIVLQGPQASKPKLSPTVAGVIGAIVTLGVAGIIFALAMFLGGIRFHRVQRGNNSPLGGFKGSSKLASDQDLALPKSAAIPAGAGVVTFGSTPATAAAVSPGPGRKTPHERVGSWELRQKEFGGHDAGEDGSPRQSFDAIEAAMQKPVQPHERV